MSAKVSGKVQDIKKTYTGLKTVPKPFALSTSKRTNVSLVVDDVDQKEEFVPLCKQVDNFEKEFRMLQPFEDSGSKEWVEPKLTQAVEPHLLSAERSRLRNITAELLSTEDKVLEDIKNKGTFKAMPLNRKLFEAKDPIPECVKPAATKVQAFKLSSSNKAKKVS